MLYDQSTYKFAYAKDKFYAAISFVFFDFSFNFSDIFELEFPQQIETPISNTQFNAQMASNLF